MKALEKIDAREMRRKMGLNQRQWSKSKNKAVKVWA